MTSSMGFEHGFCKVETDIVPWVRDDAIRLVNTKSPKHSIGTSSRPAVAEVSSEEKASVENRTRP